MVKTDYTNKTKTTLTVGELIDILSTVENQNLPLFIYDTENAIPLGIYEEDVDLSISDRVDIHIP